MEVRRLPRSLTELIISSTFIAFELPPIKVVILSISLPFHWHIFVIFLPLQIKMHYPFKCICSHPWNNYFWIWGFLAVKNDIDFYPGRFIICINRPRNAASSRLMTPRLIQLIIQDHLFLERNLFSERKLIIELGPESENRQVVNLWAHTFVKYISLSCLFKFIPARNRSKTARKRIKNEFGSKFKITKRGINTHLVWLS